MIKFMGNGKQIENVVRCLNSGFVNSIFHPKSGACCFVNRDEPKLASVVRFMNDHGYRDIYVLNVVEWWYFE